MAKKERGIIQKNPPTPHILYGSLFPLFFCRGGLIPNIVPIPCIWSSLYIRFFLCLTGGSGIPSIMAVRWSSLANIAAFSRS